jgi:GMP reductase
MHRFDRHLADDIELANSEGWKTISFSVGVKLKDKIHVTNIGKNSNLRVDFLTIDIAHGHCRRMKNMISHIKKHLPDTKIIAGNVATPTAVKDLANWGADVVKVGIGQGSPCTTKDKTGFTIPMFSCVLNCAGVYANQDEESSHEFMYRETPVPIIADGDIKFNGDIAKAIVAGADMVMSGGMFAACADSPAVKSVLKGISYKEYFGSASAENKGNSKNVEGKLTNIRTSNMTYEEKLKEIEQDIQSSISYAGGGDLRALKHVEYRRVT